MEAVESNAQPFKAFMKLRANGARRNLQSSCDRSKGESLGVPQQDRGPVRFFKFADEARQELLRFVACEKIRGGKRLVLGKRGQRRLPSCAVLVQDLDRGSPSATRSRTHLKNTIGKWSKFDRFLRT